MKEDNNDKLDLRIKKIRKISGILGGIGLLLMALVLIFDLRYPNILFSIILTPAIALVFISAGMYIASWIMDMHLAYKRKQYISLALLILSGIV
jgi:hypothetical protein